MKIELNKLYNYIFGDWADIEKHIKQDLPPEVKANAAAKKMDEIKKFFLSYNKDNIYPILVNQNNSHLINILFPDTAKPEYNHRQVSDEKTITEELNSLEKKYGLLQDEHGNLSLQTKLLFRECLSMTELVADNFENNNDMQNSVAYLHAYKMLVLFGNDPKSFLTKVDNYLKNHNYWTLSATPVHDAIMPALPTISTDKIHLNDWRTLIQKKGPDALKLFNMAPAIEKSLGGRCPRDYDEACAATRKIRFKNEKMNPPLAKYFVDFNLDEELFDRTVVIDKGRKKQDNLPTLSIHGADIDAKYADYHLVKLPIDDPIAYVLGNVTNCCQHMGGHSEQCVIDGVTLKNNGFYVLLKSKRKSAGLEEKKSNPNPLVDGKINYEKFDIVGQGYAWLSQQDNLVFDSWENKNPEPDNNIIPAFLKRFAQTLVQQKDSPIMRVMIGTGGKTPEIYRDYPINYAERMKEGMQYGDSAEQATIFCNDDLRNSYVADIHSKVDKLLDDTGLNNRTLQSRPDLLKKWLTEGCFSSAWGLNIQSILTEDNLDALLTTYSVEQQSLEGILTALTQVKNAGYEINNMMFTQILRAYDPGIQCQKIIQYLDILKEEKLELEFEKQKPLIISDLPITVKDILNALLSKDAKLDHNDKVQAAIREQINHAVMSHLEYCSAYALLRKENLEQDITIRTLALESSVQPVAAAQFLIQWQKGKFSDEDFTFAERFCVSSSFIPGSANQFIRCFTLLKENSKENKEFLKEKILDTLLSEADISPLEKTIIQLKDANMLDDTDIEDKICKRKGIASADMTKDIINAFTLLREAKLDQNTEIRARVLRAFEYTATGVAKDILAEFAFLKELNINLDKATLSEILGYNNFGDQQERNCNSLLKIIRAFWPYNDVLYGIGRSNDLKNLKDIYNALDLLSKANLDADDEIRGQVLAANMSGAEQKAKEIIAARAMKSTEEKPSIDDANRLLAIRSFVVNITHVIQGSEDKTVRIFPVAHLTEKNECLKSLDKLLAELDEKKTAEIENRLLHTLIKFHGDLVASNSPHHLKEFQALLFSYGIHLPDGLKITADHTPNDAHLFSVTLGDFKKILSGVEFEAEKDSFEHPSRDR